MGKDLQLLPEDCLEHIISLTSPVDAFRSSCVSTVFKYAASSDSVWGKFLGSDYQEIISASPNFRDSSLVFSSKKELFTSLCKHPIHLGDDRTRTFTLEKCTGKRIYMLGARDLTIRHGSDECWWRWRPMDGSRFPEVAELLDVCWLEITGRMETRLLSPKTTYGVYLVINFAEHVYGFNYFPVQVEVGFAERSGGRSVSGPPAFLCTNANMVDAEPGIEVHLPKERGDGWMEIQMGEFFNDEGEDGEVEMNMKHLTRGMWREGRLNGGHWKRGLIVEGIEVRPK